MKNKSIDLYAFIYNDEDILPYFLSYYSFVKTMTFIDSGSDDNTLKILKSFNGDIRITQTGLKWWDHNELHIYKNEIWKDSKADLVFFPDVDEIFYRPDLVEFLAERKNDIYEMQGFEMVSDGMPKESLLEFKEGVPFQMYNKSTIFNPRINIYFPNAHIRYSLVTNVSIGDIKLLHYRSLGIDMMKKRRDRERDRLPVTFKERSIHTDKELELRHEYLIKNATKVI